MEGSNLLTGIGLFVCVGAIVLIAVVAFAARALMGNRNKQKETMWNTRGEERPQYDDPNVETRGGFGGVPSTGQRDRDSGFGQTRSNQPPSTPRQSSGFGGSGGARSFESDRDKRNRDRADDDDVRSSGGFGGG